MGPRFAGEVGYLRFAESSRILVELHTFFHHAARHVGYRLLVPFAAPGHSGLLELSRPAHIIVCALHLLHHAPAERKRIWLRDLVVLGAADTVHTARRLADLWEVRWAVEHALALTEEAIGVQGWHPHPDMRSSIGRGAVGPGGGWVSSQVAILRSLSFREGAAYVLSRIDPARFRRTDGGVQRGLAAHWAARMLRSAVGLRLH